MRTQTVGLYLAKRPTKKRPKRKEWIIRWIGEDGRKLQQRLGEPPAMAKRDAEKFRRQRQAELDKGEVPAHEQAKISLGDFFAKDRETRPRTRTGHLVAEGSWDNIKAAMNCCEAVLGEKTDVAKVVFTSTERFIKVRGEEVSESRIRTDVANLSGVWQRGKKRGLCRANPWAEAEIANPAQKDPVAFCVEEVKALVEASPNQWWRDLLLLAAATAFDRENLLALRWAEDVDLERGLVWSRVRGLDETSIVSRAKRRGRERSGGLAPWAVEMLRARREREPTATYVFLSDRQAAKVEAYVKAKGKAKKALVSSFSTQWGSILKRAREAHSGLRWEAHHFRHLRNTHATLNRDLGVALLDNTRSMGHAKSSTTEGSYVDPHGREGRVAEKWAVDPFGVAEGEEEERRGHPMGLGMG